MKVKTTAQDAGQDARPASQVSLMPNVLRLFRTAVAGRRPPAGAMTTGEIYVNLSDLQFGVNVGDTSQVSTPGTPHDLLAVRYFSALAAYVANDYVIQAATLYAAIGGNSPLALFLTSHSGTRSPSRRAAARNTSRWRADHLPVPSPWSATRPPRFRQAPSST